MISGYAGNVEPQYIIPTTIGVKEEAGGRETRGGAREGVDDLDFFIGDEANSRSAQYQVWQDLDLDIFLNFTLYIHCRCHIPSNMG